MLALAAALERESEHPLAKAIVSYADSRNIPPAHRDRVPQRHRTGCDRDRRRPTSDRRQRATDGSQGIDISPVAATQKALADGGGGPPSCSPSTGKPQASSLSPTRPRDTAKAAIDALHEQGIQVAMLTGDNKPTATRIAALLGIDTVIADVLPKDKSAKIAELQASGRKVAMVGDGVNDAPALAQADLGIAIGAGTDVAIETADVVLMRSDPLDVAIALKIGKGTLRKMRQNLGWAVGYNTIALPIAAGLFYPAFGSCSPPRSPRSACPGRA